MLKDLLKRAELTQKELAERLGLSPDTVSHWQGNVPQYAIAYLELYVKHREAEITREQMREWLL